MSPTRDAEWRSSVLAYDLDSGSKGDLDMIRFRDEIVTAKRTGQCCLCFGAIVIGTLTRRETAKVDGMVSSIRHCQDCCDAMAAWPESDAIEDRYDLGRTRAEANR